MIFRIGSYNERETGKGNLFEEMRHELSEMEIHLIESQHVVTVRGKRGSPVPVLIPRDCHPALDFISNVRVRKTIRVESPYLFANSGLW